jgi:hypothetical protein
MNNLKRDLEYLENEYIKNKSQWIKMAEDHEKNLNPGAALRCRQQLEWMELNYKRNKSDLILNHEKSLVDEKQKEFDRDFLRGFGPFYEAIKSSCKDNDVVIGYVMISQHQNYPPDQIISDFTTFQDLLDSNKYFNWRRRRFTEELVCANVGEYLFAVKFGGVLKLIDFNPDTSD